MNEQIYLTIQQQWGFSGISTFAHMQAVKCLIEPDERYDIAIIGAPFDTAVSYRPGTYIDILLYLSHPLI